MAVWAALTLVLFSFLIGAICTYYCATSSIRKQKPKLWNAIPRKQKAGCRFATENDLTQIQNQIHNIFQIYKQEHLTWKPEKKKNKWHPRPSPHYFHQTKLLQKTLEPLLFVKRVKENGRSGSYGLYDFFYYPLEITSHTLLSSKTWDSDPTKACAPGLHFTTLDQLDRFAEYGPDVVVAKLHVNSSNDIHRPIEIVSVVSSEKIRARTIQMIAYVSSFK